MLFVGMIVAGVAVAAGLVIAAMGENMLYFYSPSQIRAGEAPSGPSIRVGGLVVEGSVRRGEGWRSRSPSPTGPRPWTCATPASCRICSARDRGSWPPGSWRRGADASGPRKSSPSTTRTTCRRRSRRPWRWRNRAGRWCRLTEHGNDGRGGPFLGGMDSRWRGNDEDGRDARAPRGSAVQRPDPQHRSREPIQSPSTFCKTRSPRTNLTERGDGRYDGHGGPDAQTGAARGART